MSDFSKAVDLIRYGHRFLVSCHRKPDADALGSAIAFIEILKVLGKTPVLYIPEDVPPPVRFLALDIPIASDLADLGPFDARWAMDTAAAELLAEGFEEYEAGGPLVIVDHHCAHGPVGDIIVRDIDACATAEVVYDLAVALGVHDMPPAARMPLYAAMAADTGGFRYSSTSAKVMRIAADLIEGGVEPWQVNYALFEGWSAAKMGLLARAIESIELDHDGQLALLSICCQDLQETGSSHHDLEGLVDYGRRLRGVEVAALVWEVDSGEAKVSLRSRGNVDVSKLAVALGGGGHRGAAGARLEMSLASAIERVRLEASALIP